MKVLGQTLPVILNSRAYRDNGAVFITWDEGAGVAMDRSAWLRPPDRGRHGAGVEWLPAHGGVSMWGGVRTVGDPEDAELDLRKIVSLTSGS